MAKTAKKSAPKTAIKKSKRKGVESWKTYIFRVLKQVHPETRISQKGMSIINNFVTDTFEKVALEASKLCRIHKRGTISSRDIQSAAHSADAAVSLTPRAPPMLTELVSPITNGTPADAAARAAGLMN